LLIGQSVAHYRITAAIGAGGMGEVYRATDTRLHRDVALKVLPPEMAASPERLERFRREARAVAALNHPHVVTIYSVEEADGVHFLTMELVEGEPLDRLIPATGMAVPRLLDIAAGLADALAAAHDKGIVHRDLKPANVMLTKGERVKVLDFGLAKMSAADESLPAQAQDRPTEVQTREGVVMGTMPYMSPEQLHGQALDHRTDLFSLGVMLYEMASGERPFRGDSSVALASAILRDKPRPLIERRKDLPEGLIRIITRCLEKSAADRFPSARDLRGALSGVTDPRVGSAPSAPTQAAAVVREDEGVWVAVLPFKCAGGDADFAALADGLADEIATGLSRFRYLSVVSSTSAARLKGEPGSDGARLGARYVLEGSLRMGGSAIRVGAQLVDTQSGAQIWSETFNRDLQASSFFGVQDDLSARIVATVADSYGVLVHSMRSAMRQKDDVVLTPAEWQFQYFAYREQITPAAHAALKSRLERALERDDRQSDLYACLAQVYVDEYAFGFGNDATSLDRALAAARRAVELDRANQFALVALAQTHFFRQDLAAFGPAAERAMALNPLNTDAVGILGLQIVHTGEFERGAAIVRRAMELNANHAGWMHFAPLWEHFHKGEYEQALERANRVDVPGLFWPFLVMAAACGHLGRRAEAEAAVRDLLALDPEFSAHARSNIASWHFASGLLEPLLEGLRKAGLSIPVTAGLSGAPRRSGTVTDSRQVRADEGFGVAVMPFKFTGARSELETLAAGLAEDIITGLSRFTYLRVRSAGNELGARYMMEGSLRQAGTKVRLAVQLVDTESAARIWAESYERPFDPDAAFELQDDLVHRIVGTCADQFGVLARSISEAVRGRDPAGLSPYEALMRGFGYHHRLTEAEHAAAREVLERAVECAPSNADCWAMLSWVTSHEYGHGFNPRPDSLDRALTAARRAVDLAPSSPLAQQALAVVSFFRKETAACLGAAERAIALNPLDTGNEAMFLITFSGDWDRGCAMIRRAMDINPHHPRWFELTLAINEYRLSNYRAALDQVARANVPELFWSHAVLAASHAQLGDLAAAGNALRDLLVRKPDFVTSGGELLGKWFDAQLAAHWIEGLRKAGLEVSKPPASISGEVRAEEGFWVAVLPFKVRGASADLTALADGLSEDIATGLSRFSYLKVIARSSSLRFVNEAVDVRAAGRELGARYVMEGNLRQAGSKLRLAVQLVDAVSGAHLWAENYERDFSPEEVFALQDDLVPRIVSTVADSSGVLPHSISEMLRKKSPDQLSPYEAVLRYFGYLERGTPEEHAKAREALELAVESAPDQANCWATLAMVYRDEHTHGFNVRPDPLARALAAAHRAVEAAPSNHLAHFALASALFFRGEIVAFRSAAERTIALNPMDSSSAAYLGILMLHEGDWERGCALVERARQLNPNHPGWYWFAAFWDAYRKQDYRAALEVALKINMPGDFYVSAVIGAAYGQLGELDAARTALQQLLAMKPDFAETARAEIGKWFGEKELVEHFLDGLRKAGLEIAGAESSVQPALRDTPSAQISIAVLPFSDMSAAKDQEYLCEGMAEEIMNALVRIDGIRVASRTSAFRAGKSGGDLASISSALSVGHVLEGSVRTAGSRMRVTAQLTDVVSGYQLWSERFDREAIDVFAIQDEIAAGVVDAVKTRLTPGTRTVHPRPHVHDLEAYRSYLLGRHLRGKEDFAGALGAFEEAVRLDPAHAPSWTGLAEITVLSAHMGMILPRDACTAARKMLATARELQGESADGLHVEAFVANLERRWEDMETIWRRALELQPDHVLALGSFGISLCARQKLDEALPLFERARQADPLASFPYTLAGWGLLMSGKVEDGLRQIEDALSFEKEDASAVAALCIANVALGRLEQAIDAGERGVAVTRRAPFFLGILGWALAAAGRGSEARTVLEELRGRPAGSPTAVSEGWLLGALGEMDDAFDVLARAEEEYQGLLCYTGLPGFDSLRSDPRFIALLQRLQLPA